MRATTSDSRPDSGMGDEANVQQFANTHATIMAIIEKAAHLKCDAVRSVRCARSNQRASAASAHARPSTPEYVHANTRRVAHSGPHLVSLHTCHAVGASNKTLVTSVIQTHRQA